MIEDLFLIEKESYRKSPIHVLDPRVKIVVTLAVILVIVSIPYSALSFPVSISFFLLFAILWGISGLSPLHYVKRLFAVLPFGIFLIFFQIFFKNRFYSEFHILYSLPAGIFIYAESIEFALILFSKFIVCISFVILLASTTRMQEMLEGAGRLGLPSEFILVMGMMTRYLFVIGYMFRKVQQAVETRCFDPFDHRLPYRYRLRQIGYIVGTIFLRSYEQGERTYTAMLCRGYGRHSYMYIKKKSLSRADACFLYTCLIFIIFVPLYFYIHG
ncbi:MAG: cobalt ECF transporter T component CbiQ [Methanomicrobiales archaeon]|nr:cobalt ECF transporter T component CbiQ [Methanomicrobiales archaeon]